MSMTIAAGFGFMNPQMKYLMNTKILAPIMKGEAKGLIPLNPLMRRVVHSAGATATATAVELFDAAVVQGNLDAETYKHITDWEKAGILFTQMLLSGYGSHVMNAPAEIRKFYGKLENELGGHIGSEGAKKVAKKYNIRLGWWTNEMLEKKYNEAKNEIYEDPKYEGQFDPKNKVPFIGADGKPTELSKKLKELDNDFLTLSKLKEQQALQEIIKQNKDSKNTYNEYQRKAAEVINVISEQSETGELQLTQEQIDFIAKCPDGILKLVARGDVVGEETGMIDSQIDRIKNEYSILSHSADYSGFKRGTKQRKEFFDLAQEQESLLKSEEGRVGKE